MGGRPKRSQWECHEPVVMALMQESLPDEMRLTQFHAMRQFLNEQVQLLYAHARIEAYGSVASNVPMQDSDVDLCIVFDGVEETNCEKKWRVTVLRAVAGILRRASYCVQKMEVRAHARVPVVCFKHSPTGLPVDINTMDQGIFKATFMRTVANMSPWLVPLIRVVKFWARRSGLNDPTDGTLNSYCLSLLSIFHLQQLSVPQLPPLWLLLPLPDPLSTPTAPLDEDDDEEGVHAEVHAEDEDEESVVHDKSKGLLEKHEQPDEEDLQNRKMPPSTQRIMHKRGRAPTDAAAKIQIRASEWRSTLAPPPQPLTLDKLLLAFFVRLSAFLLARFRRFDDSCMRTASTWAGTLSPCRVQQIKLSGKSKGRAAKYTGKNGVSDDASQVSLRLLRELLCTLQKYWSKSGGCAHTHAAASARVLDLAPLMLPEDDVSALREDFAVVATGENCAGAGTETSQGGSASGLGGVGTSGGAGAPTMGAGSWKEVEERATRHREKLDRVREFLLAVPRSTRCNEHAAGSKKRAVVDADASSEEHESGFLSRSELGQAPAHEPNACGSDGVSPKSGAGEPAMQSSREVAEGAVQVRNLVLEKREDGMILDMSSSEDGEGACKEQGDDVAEANDTPEEGSAVDDDVSGIIPEENVPVADDSAADGSTQREAVSAADTSAFGGESGALSDADGCAEQTSRLLRFLSVDGESSAALKAPQAPHLVGTPSSAAAPVPQLDASAPPPVDAPWAPAPSTSVTTGTSIPGGAGSGSESGGKRSQGAPALFRDAMSNIQRNIPPLHASNASGSAQKHREYLMRMRSPEEELRSVCDKRLAALGCLLGVEDPFDESDNAARTLRYFDRLLVHALMPVIYGVDALAYCLKKVPAADSTAGAAQSAQDDLRHACNIMQRFEHPIQPGSEERGKIDALAKKWSRSAPQFGAKNDGNIRRKLTQAHNEALQISSKEPLLEEPDAHMHDRRHGVRGQNRNGAAAVRGPHSHSSASNRNGMRGHPQPPPNLDDSAALTELMHDLYRGGGRQPRAPQPPHSAPTGPDAVYRSPRTPPHPYQMIPPSGWPQRPQGPMMQQHNPQVARFQQQFDPTGRPVQVAPFMSGSSERAGHPLGPIPQTQAPPLLAYVHTADVAGHPVQVSHVQRLVQHQDGANLHTIPPARSLSHSSGGTPVAVSELFQQHVAAHVRAPANPGPLPVHAQQAAPQHALSAHRGPPNMQAAAPRSQQDYIAPTTSGPDPRSHLVATSSIDAATALKEADKACRAASSSHMEEHQSRWNKSRNGAPPFEECRGSAGGRNRKVRGRGGRQGGARGQSGAGAAG